MISKSSLVHSMSFDALLESHAFTDFRISINGELFYIHKAIVSQRSGFFKKLFASDPTIIYKEVKVPDDLVPHFENVLYWMYSSKRFHVEKSTISKIVRLAILLETPVLLDMLVCWVRSNVDYTNVLYLYAELYPYCDDLPEQMFSFMHATIEKSFEMLKFSEIAETLPFDIFIGMVSQNELEASHYARSAAIVEYLAMNQKLTCEQKTELFNLYLANNWAVNVSQMFSLIEKDRESEMIDFTARHLSVLTEGVLSEVPDDVLVKILSSDVVDATCERDVMRIIRLLTSSSTLVNKVRNRKLWGCVRDTSNTRTYLKKPVTTETLKCLVLGSCIYEELNDIREMLIEAGFTKENVLVFNADKTTPPMEFLFNFDVIFVFTLYQFESGTAMSEMLTNFLINKGGGLVTAYGFMRNDEWGCGERELLDLMPVTRGRPCSDIPATMQVDSHSSLLPTIKNAMVGGRLPRAMITVKENAKLIASYQDGIPFAAYTDVPNSNSKIVALNFYPVSSRAMPYGRSPTSPITMLISSAVKMAAGIEL